MRLLHFAPVSLERRILRSGLIGAPVRIDAVPESVTLERAVFAMPVLADFASSHQWLRELRRFHDERMVAVHFRVPDAELVWVGRYGQAHALLPATKASRWVSENGAGAEMIVPRSIRAKEVLQIRQLNQRVGWTETPERQTWTCLCPVCLPRGSRDLMRRVRQAAERTYLEARQARTDTERASVLRGLEMPLERARGRLPADRLLRWTRSPSSLMRRTAAELLGYFTSRETLDALWELMEDSDSSVIQAATRTLVRRQGLASMLKRLTTLDADTAMALVDEALGEADARVVTETLERAARVDGRAIALAVSKAASVMLRDEDMEPSLKTRLARLAG